MLQFAIQRGNTDVLNELLDAGADVDSTFGVLQTSPLQWAVWCKQLDIVRLLFHREASQDHINILGWDITFFCWDQLDYQQGSVLDILNLLAEDAYQNLSVADTKGWTALYRAAAAGRPEEVVRLIELGADPYQAALPLRWNAIHHAVFHGNFSTFEALLPYYGDSAIIMADERGWTLLHIAASAGHDQIIRNLLRLGANPQARSRPFATHMPQEICNRKVTPQEAAAAQGLEREMQYMIAVQEHLEKLLDDAPFFDAKEVAI